MAAADIVTAGFRNRNQSGGKVLLAVENKAKHSGEER